jgi:hypothetical protein
VGNTIEDKDMNRFNDFIADVPEQVLAIFVNAGT